ncbi:MAG: ankyrin repeat domain-containing protein [Candidatus Chromulinivorax sp.]|nr:ankyrin repeat domain-containing protein [Candidatus Chromulinivorax sp.]
MNKKCVIFFVMFTIFDCAQASDWRVTPEYVHSSLARIVCWTSETYAIDVMNTISMNKEYLNAQDDYGDTALIVASRCGKEYVVRALLKKGAVMGIKNTHGQDAASAAMNNTIRAILNLHVVEDDSL